MRGLFFVMVLVVSLAVVPGAAADQRLPAPPPERFTVPVDDHPMAVWARVPEAEPRGVILLLHGRTWSSRPDFDLQVPGLQRSVLQSLADRGFAAYALDFRGYGETPRDATGWLTPRRSAADVTAVLVWLRLRHPGLPPPALVGWSRGAAVAQLVAQAAPERLSALVLFGFAEPEPNYGDPVLPEKPQSVPNTESGARSDFISPRVMPPAALQAFVAQAMAADPVLADLKGDDQFNVLRPARVTVPTLILFGERDPGILLSGASRFFAELGTPDKQLVSLPGADHAAQLEDTHDRWIRAVVSFVDVVLGASAQRPAPTGVSHEKQTDVPGVRFGRGDVRADCAGAATSAGTGRGAAGVARHLLDSRV
jgi:pimeloyl-ACP methyl ester carboxylesterase